MSSKERDGFVKFFLEEVESDRQERAEKLLQKQVEDSKYTKDDTQEDFHRKFLSRLDSENKGRKPAIPERCVDPLLRDKSFGKPPIPTYGSEEYTF